MDQSSGPLQSANNKLIYLREEQSKHKEGSTEWYDLQEKITQIIAQNFWYYVNR